MCCDLENNVCAIIPTYDNGKTVRDVIERTVRHVGHVIVVDDGSGDDTRRILDGMTLEDVTVVRHDRNKGKGAALKTGFRKALAEGYTHAVTLDADGQHYPEDIPLFLAALEKHPESLMVGERDLQAENMPGGNSFANRFSNFWFRLQTGVSLHDTQTGFRLYPLHRLPLKWPLSSRYEAELALLVYTAWQGTELLPVPIRVYYPPAGERVSHFRPGKDFARISLLNVFLCFGAVVYGWPRRLIRKIFK